MLLYPPNKPVSGGSPDEKTIIAIILPTLPDDDPIPTNCSNRGILTGNTPVLSPFPSVIRKGQPQQEVSIVIKKSTKMKGIQLERAKGQVSTIYLCAQRLLTIILAVNKQRI